MTANSFARVSFLLFGVLLIVQFLVGLGLSVSGVPLVFVTGVDQPTSFLSQAGTTLGIRFGAGVLFNLIPGVVFLLKADKWADRVAPSTDEASQYIEFTALLSIGLTLLGYFFLISGLAGVIGGIAVFAITDEIGREVVWRQSASSVALLVSGIAVAFLGRRAG